jgi:tetratricopeptide (TPR) repeat protein
MIEYPPQRARGRAATIAIVAGLVVSSALAGAAAVAQTRGHLLERLRSTLVEADGELSDGRLDRAAALYGRVRDEASSLGPTSLPLARALDGLGDVHRLRGRPAEAVEPYLRAVEQWESLLGPRQPRLATTLHNLGAVYLAQDRPDLAAPRWRRALEIWETTLGPDSAQARAARRWYRVLDRRPG